MCDICGVNWHRADLIRKADGLLYCPDDVRGEDSVTLSRENAQAALERRGPKQREADRMDKDPPEVPPPVYRP